jgi:hypothetical protein
LAQAAALASANYFGYLIGALACTAAPPRCRIAVAVGLAVVGVATAAMAAGTDLTLWLPLWFACGAASACVLVGVSAWSLPVLAASGRGPWSGWVFAGVGGGIVLVGTLAWAAPVLGLAHDVLWLLLGGLAVLAALHAWASFGHVPSGVPGMRMRAARFSGCERRLILCYALFGLGYIVPATFLPAMARARMDDPLLFGAGWPLFGAAAVASTVLAGRMLRVAGPLPVWRHAALLMGAGTLVPALMPGIWSLLVAAICVGGTFMVITLAGMETARHFGPGRSPRLMAAMTAGFAAGQLLGPLAMIGSGMRTAEPLCLVAACALVGSAWLLPARSAAARFIPGG